MSPTSQIGLDRLCWHNFENNRHAPKRIRNYARIVGENFRQKRIIGAVSESTSPKVKQLVNLLVNGQVKGMEPGCFVYGFWKLMARISSLMHIQS